MSEAQQSSRKTIYTQPTSELQFMNQWSSGVCDCCTDCKSCCLAYWCWPCFLCCLDRDAGECPCTTVGIMYLGAHTTGLAILRAKIRAIYKIEGSVIGDCCCSYFCPCCIALQIHRELKYKSVIQN